MITETHAMFAAIRVFSLGLPEAHEVEAWERPTFRVRNKIFAMPRERDGARPSIWCKAAPGVQMLLVSGDPETFYAPPYVGPKGWIGIVLDAHDDLDYVTSLLEESYRLVAPKTLVKVLDAAPHGRDSSRCSE